MSSESSTGADHLTGLLPRGDLEEACRAFDRKTSGEVWAVIMMDLDGFKLLNDVFGHAAGDAALRRLGSIVLDQVRHRDLPIRYGGDEIVVVMPETGAPGALDLCNRLRDEIRRNRLHDTLEITVSAGIACSAPDELELNRVVERADRALLAAKDSGRDRVYFYSSEMDSSTRPEISFNHFVGRRNELRRLRSLLRESLESGLRIALVSGEEGLGKTRLLMELEHYAEFRGSTVLYSPSVGTAGAHPYSVALGPVSRALELTEPEELAEICRRVEPLHPALLELLPQLTAKPRHDSGFFGTEGTRYRIFEDIAKVLQALAGRHRLLLAYEDIQLMPETDLDLLIYCAKALTENRLMFVFSCDESETAEIRCRRIASLDPEPPVEKMHLERLTERDSSNLVLFTLRDPRVPEELMRKLYRSSGGNPLFLREILCSMASRGEIDLESSRRDYSIPEKIELPDNLTQIIDRRLSEQEADTLKVLEIAALTDGDFGLDMLEEVTGGNALDLASALDPAVRTGLLAEVESTACLPMYRFSYDAARQLLREKVGRNLSILYHKKIAQWMSRRMEAGDDSLTGRIALHYIEAGEDELAASVAFEAAMRALSHGANRQAAGWLESYLSSVPSEEPAQRRIDAMRELGRLYSISGRTEQGHQVLSQALAMAGPQQCPGIMAELAENLYMQSRYSEALEMFTRLLNQPADSGLKVRALMRRAFIETLEGEYPQAEEDLSRGLSLIEEMDPGALRESMLALYHTRRGDLVSLTTSDRSAEEHYRRALEIYRGHEDRLGEATVLNNMSDLHCRVGDYLGEIEVLQRVEEINRRHDDALGMAIAAYNLADANASIGRFGQAREYYQRYMSLSDRIENRLGLAYGRLGLGRLETEQGRYGVAEEYLREAVALFRKLGSSSLEVEARLALAESLISAGRLASAEVELEGLEDRELRADQRDGLDQQWGLYHLRASRGDDADGTHLAKALGYLRQGVEENAGSLQIPELAERWLALIEAEAWGDGEGAAEAGDRARAMLSARLGEVPSQASRAVLEKLPAVEEILHSDGIAAKRKGGP